MAFCFVCNINLFVQFAYSFSIKSACRTHTSYKSVFKTNSLSLLLSLMMIFFFSLPPSAPSCSQTPLRAEVHGSSERSRLLLQLPWKKCSSKYNCQNIKHQLLDLACVKEDFPEWAELSSTRRLPQSGAHSDHSLQLC